MKHRDPAYPWFAETYNSNIFSGNLVAAMSFKYIHGCQGLGQQSSRYPTSRPVTEVGQAEVEADAEHKDQGGF